MSLESTRGPAEHDRDRRDRLEQLQVQLRETRAALATVEADVEREQGERRKMLTAAEERLAAANRRLALLKERSASCNERREALKQRIRKVRLERDGPVQKAGLFNEQPPASDWSRRDPWEEKERGWVPVVIWSAIFVIYMLFRLLH